MGLESYTGMTLDQLAESPIADALVTALGADDANICAFVSSI
ncbi:hypothetical protein [Nonomuraea sp. NPDC048826]